MQISRASHAAYCQALARARQIVRERLVACVRANAGNADDAEEDLAQSIVGTERVVSLILTEPFDETLYEPALLEAANEVGRAFFPDVFKRFIVPYDALRSQKESDPVPVEAASRDEIGRIVAALPDDLRGYFEQLVAGAGDMPFSIAGALSDLASVEQRLERLRRNFLVGVIPPNEALPQSGDLTDSAILLYTKYVAAGLSISFPWGFFSRQTQRRISISVEYLVRVEMRCEAQEALEKDIIEYLALGLGPALRRCGGSVNRLLATAFPNEIRPWMGSHVPSGYWDEIENRREAIRWLIEGRLGVAQDEIADAVHGNRLTKQDFRRAGLTWLLKNVYGWSVADALADAYPELRAWERFHRVPVNLWQGTEGKSLAAAAINWALKRSGITLEMLRTQDVARVIKSALAQWHLGASFREAFGEDPAELLDVLFPGAFQRWEISHLPGDTWDDPATRHEAMLWLLAKLGVAPDAIPQAVAEGTLTPATFRDAGMGGLLRTTGSVWRAVDNVFPGRFARWELGAVPKSHWRVRTHVREAVLWAIQRLGCTEADIERALSRNEIGVEEFSKMGLGHLAGVVFQGDMRSLLQVAGVISSPRRVPLSWYYRRLRSMEDLAEGLSQPNLLAEGNDLERRARQFRAARMERRRREER